MLFFYRDLNNVRQSSAQRKRKKEAVAQTASFRYRCEFYIDIFIIS